MADYRNEVWNQIEGHTHVADGQSEKQLRGKRGTFILQNALIHDQFTLERASNLFAPLKGHTVYFSRKFVIVTQNAAGTLEVPQPLAARQAIPCGQEMHGNSQFPKSTPSRGVDFRRIKLLSHWTKVQWTKVP